MMQKMVRILRISLLVAAAGLLAGCYKMGSLAHPQLKTVAIAPVINDTTFYNASATMRDLLCEAFQLDGSLKLVSLEEADCIVYAKITTVSVSASGDNNYDEGRGIYLPALWKITVDAEFTVAVPGRATPLVGPRGVSGYAQYQKNVDPQISQLYGLAQACRMAAQDVVSLTTEAW